MKDFDITQLKKAIVYTERMINGHHPVHNSLLNLDDTLRDKNVIRYLGFVKEILEQVHENRGHLPSQKEVSAFSLFPVQLLDQYTYIEDKSIAHVLKQLYEPVSNQNLKKISAPKMTSLLKDEGYLKDEINPQTGETIKVPTDKGKAAGIYQRKRDYNGQVYLATIYNESAQKLILQLIKEQVTK